MYNKFSFNNIIKSIMRKTINDIRTAALMNGEKNKKKRKAERRNERAIVRRVAE